MFAEISMFQDTCVSTEASSITFYAENGESRIHNETLKTGIDLIFQTIRFTF